MFIVVDPHQTSGGDGDIGWLDKVQRLAKIHRVLVASSFDPNASGEP